MHRQESEEYKSIDSSSTSVPTAIDSRISFPAEKLLLGIYTRNI